MEGSDFENSFDSEQESEEEINPVYSLFCLIYALYNKENTPAINKQRGRSLQHTFNTTSLEVPLY